MQDFFGHASRNAEVDKQTRMQGTWAVLKHMAIESDTSLEVQHDNCPKGNSS